MRSFCRKSLSIIMSVVLVVGLCPGLAYAGQTQGSEPLAAGSVDLTAQEAATVSAILYNNGDFVIQTTTAADGLEGHTEADVAYKYADVSKKVPADPTDPESWETWPWYDQRGDIEAVFVKGPVALSDMAAWFDGCAGLTYVNLSDLSTDGLISTASLFNGCTNLRTVVFSGVKFSDSHPNTYGSMFDRCWTLSEFVFDEDTTLAQGVLPEGAWALSGGDYSYDTTAELVTAFNAAPATHAGTWFYTAIKTLADAEVQTDSTMVKYVEGGLPDVSKVVTLVTYHGYGLVSGVDYKLVIKDEDGKEVTSVPKSANEYYVHVVGLGDFEGTEHPSSYGLTVVDEYDIAGIVGGWYDTKTRYTGLPYSGSYYHIYNSLTGDNLNVNVDFTVSYKKDGQNVVPIEPGEYDIIVKGCGMYHGEGKYGTLTIAEKNDLSYAGVSYDSMVHWIGKTVNSVLVSVCGVPLSRDEYTVKYYDENGVELSAINGPGKYGFIVEPTSGAYINTYNNVDPYGFDYAAITVFDGDEVPGSYYYDKYDLSNASFTVNGASTYAGGTTSLFDFGSGVALPTVAMKGSSGAPDPVAGVDYVVGSWKNGNGEIVDKFKLDVDSWETQEYSCEITAAGDTYHGKTKLWVGLYDGYNLSYATLTIASEISVNGTPIVDYTGSPVNPQATMTMGDQVVAPENYDLLFAKCEGSAKNKGQISGDFTGTVPTQPGLYCVRAQAKGAQYTGTFKGNRYSPGSSYGDEMYFQVGDRYDIANATVSTGGQPYKYTGASVHPAFNVRYPTATGSTRKLTDGTDFEITGYKDAKGNAIDEAVEEGEYTATLTGIGSMSGSIEAPFTVQAYGNFSEATFEYNGVAVSGTIYVPYTGKEVHPALTVTMGGETLVEGTDYTIESIKQREYASNMYSDGPIALGEYTMTLRGNAARGIVGVRTINYNIVDGRDLSQAGYGNSVIQGIEGYYAYTGAAVDPKPIVKVGNKTLTEGTDYAVEYRQTERPSDNSGYSYTTRIVDSCIDEGQYTIHITGYGDYSRSIDRSFYIVKPENDFSKAEVYVVKDGVRTLMQETYTYTGSNVLDGTFEVVRDGKTLTPDVDYKLRLVDNRTGATADSAIEPGNYQVVVSPVTSAKTSRSLYCRFTIGSKTVEKQGVKATGSVFTDKADATAGTEVAMSVEPKTKEQASTATAKAVVKGCENAGADYVGVVDVSLAVVKSATGEQVSNLSEGFGELELSFPVDAKYNGTAARVVQVHTDAKTGVVSAIDHGVTRVKDGAVGVTVDRLSEFVIMVGTQAEDMTFERPKEVAKPQAESFVYDGKAHTGVQPSKGYVLSGTHTATEIGEYKVTVTLAEGYQWADGTTGAVEATWKIVKDESEVPPPERVKTDLAKYKGNAKGFGFVDLDDNAWYMRVGKGLGSFADSDTLYLDYTVGRKLMTGTDPTHFSPNGQVSRAMVAMVLFRLGNPGVENGADANETGLHDVAGGQWYTRAVNWCFRNGVVTGYKDANGNPYEFRPDAPVSREEMALMFARYCVAKGGKSYVGTAAALEFPDAGDISSWALEGVTFCKTNGIISGKSDTGRFDPHGNSLRCEMSKVLAVAARMLE